jgi:hypothetical protein
MRFIGLLIFILIIGSLPAAGHTEIYHYIDKDGVERYSNQPPPEGATIIGKEKELEYDEEFDRSQQQKNQEAADEYIEQNKRAEPADPPATTSQSEQTKSETNIYIIEDDDDDVIRYRRHRPRERPVREPRLRP